MDVKAHVEQEKTDVLTLIEFPEVELGCNMRIFRKVTNAGNSKHKEVCLTISQTVPDQTMSIREIMRRFASGTLDNIELPYDYNEDDEDFRGLDPADIYNEVQRGNEVAQEIESRRSKKKADADRQKLENEIRQKIENEKPKEDA